jgi:hypothetical protein
MPMFGLHMASETGMSAVVRAVGASEDQSGAVAWPSQQVEASAAVLERNLKALELCCSSTKQRVMEAHSAETSWVMSRDGLLTGSYEGRQLASKIVAKQEAMKFAEGMDLIEHGCVVVRGFGVGHHAAAVFEKSKGRCAVVVYEPDVRLVRAVLERVDLSSALATGRFAIVTGHSQAEVAEALSLMESLCAIGMHVADHQPSLVRWQGDAGKVDGARVFLEAVQAALSAIRLTFATLFRHDELTVRNMIQNVDHYALCGGVGHYAGVLGPARVQGAVKHEQAPVGKRPARPAVVVSAGPSLARTIDQLARPGVRERVLIVATQTVLKALLARGIKPHLVCALDHHELSARFYEGLSQQELEGVTLLFEAKVNPAVPAAFAGEKRLCDAQVLNVILGEDLSRPMGRIVGGSTVAHLCYETARYMGCDPVLLIGQDLGFSDGTYYSSGAAIHEVWGIEVNRFQSLESMEWMRIKRNAGILRKAVDVHGKPMYTDEQMHGYLQHFERLFVQDQRNGLTTIDAGGGGIAKAGTSTRAFADVIDEILEQPAPAMSIAEVLAAADATAGVVAAVKGSSGKGKLEQVKGRLTLIRQQAMQLREMSKLSKDLLIEIREHYADAARVDRLVQRLDGIRQQYSTLRPAADLMHVINSAGTFRRQKGDRALEMAAELSLEDKERRQIERDVVNVELLGEAAERLKKLMDGALAMLAGGPRITREQASDEGEVGQQEGAKHGEGLSKSVVGGVLSVMRRDWMGRDRELESLTICGQSTTLLSLRRMLEVEGLREVVVVTDVPEFVQQQVACLSQQQQSRARVIDVRSISDLADDTMARWTPGKLVAARAWSRHAWRGGLAGLTIWDEVLCSGVSQRSLVRLIEQLGLDAVLVACGDWPVMDSGLMGDLVKRHQDNLGEQPFTFAASAAGSCGILVGRETLQKLIVAEAEMQGTIGIPLAYGPLRAMPDLLGESCCAPVVPGLRQVAVRCTAETRWQCEMIEQALKAAGHSQGDRVSGVQASSAINAWLQSDAAMAHAAVRRLLELEVAMDDSLPLDVQARRVGVGISHVAGNEVIARLQSVLGDCAGESEACVTLISRGDVHPQLAEIVAAARQLGAMVVCVQVDLLGDDEAAITRLKQSGADVIAVEMIADDEASFVSLTGLSASYLTRVKNRAQDLLDAARRSRQRGPWHVAFMMARCDATIGLYDEWFDRAILAGGWACITPRHGQVPGGERIGPLAEPAIVQWRRHLFERSIDARGGVRVPSRPSKLLPGMVNPPQELKEPARA